MSIDKTSLRNVIQANDAVKLCELYLKALALKETLEPEHSKIVAYAESTVELVMDEGMKHMHRHTALDYKTSHFATEDSFQQFLTVIRQQWEERGFKIEQAPEGKYYDYKDPYLSANHLMILARQELCWSLPEITKIPRGKHINEELSVKLADHIIKLVASLGFQLSAAL